VGHVPTLVVNDAKLKIQQTANAVSNFFITITEKLNIQQIEKGDAISILTVSFLGNISSIKIIPITEIKKYNTFPKIKSSVYCEITSKILEACTSVNSHPLSYIYNHLLYTGIFPVLIFQ
jgi:hypothetical protein